MTRSLYYLTIISVLLHFRCAGQTVGGGCEGCEAIHEFDENDLTNTDTLPGFENSEPKLKLSGTVYHRDGKTPASGVILYVYHTDRMGIYPKRGNETGWARRHGYIRGWVKTGEQGNYTFYTFRPAAYPDGTEPEHIHLTVKEPDKNEYYLDDYLFEDDPILTDQKRKFLGNRGGSGILSPVNSRGMLHANRDLILGLNVPDYE